MAHAKQSCCTDLQYYPHAHSTPVKNNHYVHEPPGKRPRDKIHPQKKSNFALTSRHPEKTLKEMEETRARRLRQTNASHVNSVQHQQTLRNL